MIMLRYASVISMVCLGLKRTPCTMTSGGKDEYESRKCLFFLHASAFLALLSGVCA
jgi:hypothetical protein